MVSDSWNPDFPARSRQRLVAAIDFQNSAGAKNAVGSAEFVFHARPQPLHIRDEGTRRISLFFVPVSGLPRTMICFRCRSISSHVTQTASELNPQPAVGKEFNQIANAATPTAAAFAQIRNQILEL